MKKYKKRIVDTILNKKLQCIGAILIEGPKWCGKTTSAEQLANTIIYVDNPEKKSQYLMLANINPKKLLEGSTPVLIDEWQLIPKVWDTIRFEVDHRENIGQFILTGSAVPASLDEVSHSGTGRFARVLMRPMSLYESGESNGEISLKALFDGTSQIFATNKLTLDDVAYLVCRGGWPRTIDLDKEISLELAYDYFDSVVRTDISNVDNVKRNPERVKRIMKTLARHQGTQVSIKALAKDIALNDTSSIDSDTISSYIESLKRIFVVEDMQAWNPNLRSKTAIRTSDTRYFVDPSIAVAALGLVPQDLINDLNTFGFIFETMCVRDLRVYADVLGGTLYHYRDKNGLECDAVMHLRNGKYGLIEIKLGGDILIEEAAKVLNTLASKIDTDKMTKPSFLMILTAIGDFAYQRNDGIYVVPIGTLKD